MLSKKILLNLSFAIIVFFALTYSAFSQATQTADFKIVVENKLKGFRDVTLDKICPIDTEATARRIFSEYGAVFISSGTSLPGKCIFATEDEVQSFQTKIATETQFIGGTQITLQKAAMNALMKAQKDAAKINLRITPRGGSLAAGRSFRETVRLWNSRFLPGLNYWVKQRKITAVDADNVRRMTIPEQVAQVLEWEKKGFYFSKDLSKSILFSVAAPGASQHNFLLALDVEQFANKEIRKILAQNGWFQTVKSDAPHFTYLGVAESELPGLGLKSVPVGNQIFWIPNLEP